MKTIEQKVSETILEKSSEVSIKDRKFNVAPPTFATLIKVSELVSTLPAVKLDSEDYITHSLMIAKDCKVIGEIIATMILGVDRPKQRIFSKPVIEELSNFIISKCSVSEVRKLLVELIALLEIHDFFVTTTSLMEINLLRKTVEVV